VCVSPDYALVPEQHLWRFVAEVKRASYKQGGFNRSSQH
jgi:hypothetical protein